MSKGIELSPKKIKELQRLTGTWFHVEFGVDRDREVSIERVVRFTGTDYESQHTEEESWAEVPDPEVLLCHTTMERLCAEQYAEDAAEF